MLLFETIKNQRLLIDERHVIALEEVDISTLPGAEGSGLGLLANVMLDSGHTVCIKDETRVARYMLDKPCIPLTDPHPPGDIHRLLQASEQLAHAVLEHLRDDGNGNAMLIQLARAVEAEVLEHCKPEPDRPFEPAEAALDVEADE